MATFLNTTGVSSELDRLINNAEEFVWLISPYLQVNQRIRELLADKDRLKIDTGIVYGKSELSAEQRDWLSSTPSHRREGWRFLPPALPRRGGSPQSGPGHHESVFEQRNADPRDWRSVAGV